MKKTSYFLLTLALLLTFAGCNQKEKKLAVIEQNLALIVDGVTEEQMGAINEIVAASYDLDADKVKFDIGHTNDTLYISCYDTFSIERPDRDFKNILKVQDLQKKFLFAALCSNSPETKRLLEQIADVPAVLKIIYADTVSHKKYVVETKQGEIEEALLKENTPTDVLNSYSDLVNAFSNDDIKLSLEKNFFVVNIYDKDYDIKSHIDSLKTEALDEDYYDIINWDKYENKMSQEIQDEADFLCLFFIEALYNHLPYIFNEIIKGNLGFELRLSGENKEKAAIARLDNDDLHVLIDQPTGRN